MLGSGSQVSALNPTYYLQPMDGPDAKANTDRAIAYCKAHPGWRLTVQTHKLLGIP